MDSNSKRTETAQDTARAGLSKDKMCTAERQYPNMYFEVKSKSDTIVLDNGTFELKAGYQGDLAMIVKNRLYRNKEKISLEPFPSSSLKSMFDGDVVVNFDVLEQTMDLVLDYLSPTSLQNLIFTATPSSPTELDLVHFLFETYAFEKVQIGYDFVYVYHKYFGDKDCVIVDFKYSSVIVCVIKDRKVLDIYKINFGGKDILEYINYCMVDKYRECRRDYRGLAEYLRVADNYEDEALGIYHEMCSGVYTRNIFLSEASAVKTPPVVKKAKRPEKPASVVPVLDYVLLNTPDEQLDKDTLKEKRRQKMIFCSTFARLKSKIDKGFAELDECIETITDELEKQSNMKKYILKQKTRFNTLKRELELREQVRREVRNKKSREFAVKFKETQLSEEEQMIKNRIADAEDDDQENLLIAALEQLAVDISKLDPEFIPFYANTVEILRGDNLGRQCVNVELIKWAEIIFDPSIIGSEQMGLSEIFENVFPATQISNVLVCGGFSFMENLENRLLSEIVTYLYSGHVDLRRVGDPQKEPFMNCQFSELFPVYTRQDYENMKQAREEMAASGQ